jgi:hypothetical protein
MPPDFEEQLQQLLHRYADPIRPRRDTFAEIKERLRVSLDGDGDEDEMEYAFTLEDTLQETMADGHDPRDQPLCTTARSSGWGDGKRALSPRARAIAGIAAVLILAVIATTIYARFVAPMRPLSPGQFTTGAFESVPLPAVPGAALGALMPSPRDPATAYVCASPQQGSTGGPISLWITHTAGQSWSRAPLPEVTGTYCEVDPAWDGSQRVALRASTDASNQIAPACAYDRFYLSDDDGASWRAIALPAPPPPASQEGDCFMTVSARHLFLDIVVNRNENQLQSLLERSDDDGRTWQRADQGLETLQPSQFQQAPWFALPLDGSGEALVTLVTNSSSGNVKQADFWVTHDAGAHWQRVPSEPLPAPAFPIGSALLVMTEPALADASRACQCVILVNTFSVFNQRAYSTHDLTHWTAAPPLPVQGAGIQVSGLYATLGLTGDGRLLALGPDPAAGVPAHIDVNGVFAKAPPALWAWDMQTGRWAVARTRLPCQNSANCYGLSYDLIGVSIVSGAAGQSPGSWFWIRAGGSGHYWRVFIPAA